MKDFTISLYNKLLNQLILAGYDFQTFSQYVKKPKVKTIMLRHDVDARLGVREGVMGRGSEWERGREGERE